MGAVNHWVALLAHKPSWESISISKQSRIVKQEKFKTKFYLLDSSNIEHLKEASSRLPDLVNERIYEKIKLGLKATDRFMSQMTIQSLFDQRAMLAKLVNCFNNDGTSVKVSEKLDFPNICKVYSNCYLQNMLRTFYRDTQSVVIAAIKEAEEEAALMKNRPEEKESSFSESLDSEGEKKEPKEEKTGWKEFGLPETGQMDKMVDSEITKFPENKGFADQKYLILKKKQQQQEDEWDRKL